MRLRAEVERGLARPLREELHADRHHLAAILAETATRPGGTREHRDWRYWSDELFLSPRWGMLGSAAVFAAVLFVVFDVSAWLDSLTVAMSIGVALVVSGAARFALRGIDLLLS
ncbi:MAG: hypothetical protein ACXWCY_25820 [Burkholderiales bacterium]